MTLKVDLVPTEICTESTAATQIFMTNATIQRSLFVEHVLFRCLLSRTLTFQYSHLGTNSVTEMKKMKQWMTSLHLKDSGSIPSIDNSTAAHRRQLLPRLDHDYSKKNNSDLIFEATQHHISYTWNLTTLSGLDKYNDCTPYNISSEWENKCLRAEIDRLVQASCSKEPLLFNSQGRFDPLEKIAFAELSHVADQVRCSMGIIRLDNARISLEHCTSDLKESAHSFRQARRRLIGRFNTDQSRVQGSEPQQLEPKERNKFLYYALVDFVTAFVARLLARTAVSNHWSQQTFSCLAAIAVKMKVLSAKMEKFANSSIATAESALETMNQSTASKNLLLIKVRADPDDDAKDIDTVDTETDTSRHYHTEKTLFNKEIFWLVRRVLHNLLSKQSRVALASCFEVHSAVYKARPDGMPTTLCSDRLGEISASADPFVMKNTYTALNMMVENLKALHKTQPHSTSSFLTTSTVTQPKKTTISCDWTSVEGSWEPFGQSIETEKVDDVVSIIVPLSLSTVLTAVSLAHLISIAGIDTVDEDPILQFKQPPRDFQAHVTISTADWHKKQLELSQFEFKDEEITTLSHNPIRFGLEAGAAIFAQRHETQQSTSPANRKREAQASEEYQRRKAKMDRWVISEDSITIECNRYITSVVVVALFVVFGGIAIPFTVGDRVKGVDPFQITFFCWGIAGLIILMAKGRYVSEWPWHEFVHRHVVCRTIQEVCDVTSMDSQFVITYLLLNEWKTILKTKGPYNGMFSRRTEDGSGFTINEPIQTSTLMLSGFTLLKVLNVFGEHVVCLDARRASESVTLFDAQRRLVCTHLEDYDADLTSDPLPAQNGKKISAKPGKQLEVKRLTRENLRVDRILGIYIRDSFFG